MTIEKKEFYYDGVIKQVVGIIDVFDSFFKKEKFDKIIEIGSGTGRFSIYFATVCKNMGAKFRTYDIKPIQKKYLKKLKSLDSDFIKGDINENKEIENLVKSEGRCLILNDGGLKVPQFNRFSPLLKNGDIIMTHDYYKNSKPFKGIIVPSDVENCIKQNNLSLIYEDIFDDYLWLCITKGEL